MDKVLQRIPAEKQALFRTILRKLSAVPGVAAVVLGGSYASGAYHAKSDLDIGIYYAENAPFDIEDIRRIAEEISADRPPTVTKFYEWGAWVNGGAWIHTSAGKVDFLYRNIDHVQRVLQSSREGKVELDYLQQPPYGFHSVIYLAETSICLPLYDPNGIIANLKSQVETYPPLMKDTILRDSLWSTEFTLAFARTFAGRGDMLNTVACLTRCFSYLTQVIFALNETYFISDKAALSTIETFPADRKPPDYAASIARILGRPGDDLMGAVNALDELFHQVADLTVYRSRYQL